MIPQNFQLWIFAATIFTSSTLARAAPSSDPPGLSDEIEVVGLDRSPGPDDGWNIRVRFAGSVELPAAVLVEATGFERQREVLVREEESSHLRIAIPSSNSPLVTLRILWQDRTGRAHGAYLLFLQTPEQELKSVEYQEAVKQLDALEPVTFGDEHATDAARLSPFENPGIPAEDRAYARQMLQRDTASVGGALTAAVPGASRNSPEPDYGCTAGSGVPFAIGLLLVVLLAVRSRRREIGLVLLYFVAAASGARPAHAQSRTVYGYIAYWDSRNVGSYLTGARIAHCDPTVHNCACGAAIPGTQDVCCFRPLDGITLKVSQDGPVLATTVTNSSGFYAMTFTGNDLQPYNFVVSYERPSAVGYAGAMQEVQLSPPMILRQVFKVVLPQNTPNYWLADIRLNPAADTSSITGNYATIWAQVTETQRAILSEGDTRYRHLYGAPQNGPDDYVLIDPTGSTGNGTDCPTSMISVDPSFSRIDHPAQYMATIYRGRVVGCSSTYYSNGVVPERNPAFPPMAMNAGRAPVGNSIGEGEALGTGLDYMISWGLRRWRPLDTSAFVIDNDILCPNSYLNSPSNKNSNSCSIGLNVTRGLWEWIDTPTAGTTSYVDNSDLTLKNVMDGLLQLAGNTGSGDGQAGEASFVQIATPCFNNENCLDNDVCAVQGSATFFCASGTLGDPNGSNIEDLATAIDSLGTAGRGNLMTSLRSTKCVDGGADDLYPFDGGYVDN